MVGTLLGNRYEVIEKIGEGGMAEVYKAKCRLLNRFVAVKILKKEYSEDKEFVDKFKGEAAAAGSISHNNIVNIYDVGSQDNINYIIMEYIQGRTLKEVIIQNGRLDYNRALDIAIQIAKALECAHKNNIIHRDIKPQNILVTDDWNVKVTDFGIAKAANSVTITNTNKVMGSAHYFSPEQARGTFVDGRTDIYSLGIVIYEMVTGRVPFDAESPVSVALKHLQEPVVPPKQINGNLPEGLNNLILKAMEKNPSSRYQNIKDILLDLQRIKNNADYKVELENPLAEQTRVMSPIIGDEEDDEDNLYKPKKNNKKLVLTLIPLALIVIAVFSFLGWYIVSKYSASRNLNAASNEIVIPSIVGLNEKEAEKLIKDSGLEFIVGSREKSDKPEGVVLSSFPEEGTKVKTGSVVKVYISAGALAVKVPNVVNLDYKVASEIIKNNGFQVGKVDYEFNNTIPADSVIRQSPEGDKDAEKNSKIDLVLSKGPEIKYTTVPNLIGRSLSEADNLLGSVNLKIGNKTSIDTEDKNQDNKIANQNPAPNTQNIKEGSTVDITYYKYKEPEKIVIPDFVKDKVKLQEAIDILKSKGLEVESIGNMNDVVTSQNPGAGTVVKGTKIILEAKPQQEQKQKDQQEQSQNSTQQ
ncbi:Stk1 family PASTA domain-containing Ser/Thr kinase [Clostridium sp. SYSU_GA19001]|uniref:Stk1 family PASTA domain-containing Ser/Thr kinase n=1 Tax=Clostridium caldaquaticum TaxID=2940653 RepID=UPI0020770FA2|nr:Stk1 family PASTA domain-containing Ser/Thr kinase [Clostridium caldaquaticum]MCM8710574.1 Stk1 family PASTA domain-containing Ser/Thr kinase [Clostridium caldaquaticum]